MGNCFGGLGSSDEQSHLANQLAETTEAADAKYMALSTNMHKLEVTRDCMFREVQEIKTTQKNAVQDISNAIKNNKPIPARHQPLHIRLQQLNNSLEKVEREIAGIQRYMRDIQLQRSAAAALSQQHDQSMMLASWGNLMSKLGVNADTVIQQQQGIETAVQDMDDIRQAVQYGVHEAVTSSSGGGGISRISELLDETVDIEDTAAAAATTTPLGVWHKDSDDTVVEMTSARPNYARPFAFSAGYASIPSSSSSSSGGGGGGASKKSIQDILGN